LTKTIVSHRGRSEAGQRSAWLLPWFAFLCGFAFGEATVKALLLRRCLAARPNESKNGALRIAAMDDPGSGPALNIQSS
jgi:uncharacterized membrane protein